jgi:hypothetical protein
MRTRALVMLVLGTAAAACAGHSRSETPQPAADGRYKFSERVSGTDLSVDGEFVVLGNEVSVSAAPGPCKPILRPPSVVTTVYLCGDFTLSFSTADPARQSRYSVVVTTQKPQRTCTHYDTDPQGKQVCTQYDMQMVDVQESHRGVLHAVRITPDSSSG